MLRGCWRRRRCRPRARRSSSCRSSRSPPRRRGLRAQVEAARPERVGAPWRRQRREQPARRRDDDDDGVDDAGAHVVVCTYEKANAIVNALHRAGARRRRRQDDDKPSAHLALLRDVRDDAEPSIALSAVVVDEVHMIAGEPGPYVEGLITKLLVHAERADDRAASPKRRRAAAATLTQRPYRAARRASSRSRRRRPISPVRRRSRPPTSRPPLILSRGVSSVRCAITAGRCSRRRSGPCRSKCSCARGVCSRSARGGATTRASTARGSRDGTRRLRRWTPLRGARSALGDSDRQSRARGMREASRCSFLQHQGLDAKSARAIARRRRPPAEVARGPPTRRSLKMFSTSCARRPPASTRIWNRRLSLSRRRRARRSPPAPPLPRAADGAVRRRVSPRGLDAGGAQHHRGRVSERSAAPSRRRRRRGRQSAGVARRHPIVQDAQKRPITTSDFQQMAGRAGRAGGPEGGVGEAILVVEDHRPPDRGRGAPAAFARAAFARAVR